MSRSNARPWNAIDIAPWQGAGTPPAGVNAGRFYRDLPEPHVWHAIGGLSRPRCSACGATFDSHVAAAGHLAARQFARGGATNGPGARQNPPVSARSATPVAAGRGWRELPDCYVFDVAATRHAQTDPLPGTPLAPSKNRRGLAEATAYGLTGPRPLASEGAPHG